MTRDQDILRRLDAYERNQSDQSKTLSAIIDDLRTNKDDVIELKAQQRVDAEAEKARDEWRKRTEKKLDGIYKLGWWVLTTFGSLTIAGIANLLYGGGGNGP